MREVGEFKYMIIFHPRREIDRMNAISRRSRGAPENHKLRRLVSEVAIVYESKTCNASLGDYFTLPRVTPEK